MRKKYDISISGFLFKKNTVYGIDGKQEIKKLRHIGRETINLSSWSSFCQLVIIRKFRFAKQIAICTSSRVVRRLLRGKICNNE